MAAAGLGLGALAVDRALLAESCDECGTTLVAGRSVATPFVGAFAGAVMARLSASHDLQ
jgi:hypothetical protein